MQPFQRHQDCSKPTTGRPSTIGTNMANQDGQNGGDLEGGSMVGDTLKHHAAPRWVTLLGNV